MESLKTALIKGIGLNEDTAEEAVSVITDWIEEDNRSETKTIRFDTKLIIGEIEGDSLSLTVTESTNVAGASIVEPRAKSYTVKFPLEANS